MGYENFILEEKDSIGIVTINRPPTNTWNLAAMEEFELVMNELENDKKVRVVVITGAGEKCFSAGFDISDAANATKIMPKGQKTWERIDRFPKPVIAAINGYAFGGGLELALSCHFRIMTDSSQAKVGLTELNLGIIPAWGGTQRLLRLVGKSKTLDMILFSKRLNVSEALEIGLIDKVSSHDKLMEDVLTFAGKLAKRPPIAVSCTLKAISAGIYEGMEAGLMVEKKGVAIVCDTEDWKEGFTAFLEKREPVFTGN